MAQRGPDACLLTYRPRIILLPGKMRDALDWREGVDGEHRDLRRDDGMETHGVIEYDTISTSAVSIGQPICLSIFSLYLKRPL